MDVIEHLSLKIKNRGITIIELVIAMTILGILGAFATSTYSNYRTRAKIASQVSIVTAHAQQIHDLKKNGKDFYLEFPYSTINEYGTIIKDIGETGANVIQGGAEIMIRSETVPPDSIKWRCIVSGDELSESRVPNQCLLGSDTFFKILKDIVNLIILC